MRALGEGEVSEFFEILLQKTAKKTVKKAKQKEKKNTEKDRQTAAAQRRGLAAARSQQRKHVLVVDAFDPLAPLNFYTKKSNYKFFCGAIFSHKTHHHFIKYVQSRPHGCRPRPRGRPSLFRAPAKNSAGDRSIAK